MRKPDPKKEKLKEVLDHLKYVHRYTDDGTTLDRLDKAIDLLVSLTEKKHADRH